MAEAIVQIKVSTTEYRFIRNELELHAGELKEKQKGMRVGKEKNAMMKREAQLRFLLEKI